MAPRATEVRGVEPGLGCPVSSEPAGQAAEHRPGAPGRAGLRVPARHRRSPGAPADSAAAATTSATANQPVQARRVAVSTTRPGRPAQPPGPGAPPQRDGEDGAHQPAGRAPAGRGTSGRRSRPRRRRSADQSSSMIVPPVATTRYQGADTQRQRCCRTTGGARAGAGAAARTRSSRTTVRTASATRQATARARYGVAREPERRGGEQPEQQDPRAAASAARRGPAAGRRPWAGRGAGGLAGAAPGRPLHAPTARSTGGCAEPAATVVRGVVGDGGAVVRRRHVGQRAGRRAPAPAATRGSPPYRCGPRGRGPGTPAPAGSSAAGHLGQVVLAAPDPVDDRHGRTACRRAGGRSRRTTTVAAQECTSEAVVASSP